MGWFAFVSAYCVLSYSRVPVAGQCMVSSCAFALSGYEEGPGEHNHLMETMNQNIGSALEKLEAAVNKANVRGKEEFCQDLKTMFYNMSVNLERVSEKIPERAECPATEEQEEYLNSMNLNLTSIILRTDERIEAVNENLTHVYLKLRYTIQSVNRSLDEKFQVMQVQLQGQSSALQTVKKSLEETFQVMNESVLSALREHDQKMQTMNETLLSAIDQINDKLNVVLDHVNENLQYLRCQDHCRNTSDVCDCSDIKVNGFKSNGVYCIYVVDHGQRYYANTYCDMTTTNGGWTVFQRRKDGSVDFYREWNEYADGFGIPNEEFWLGNNFLHLLTSQRRYRLRIDLEDFEGEKRYAEYSTFNISSSADKYRLGIGTYSGNAGDGLRHSNNQRFTTEDNDNDGKFNMNCAVYSRGPWWYHDCENVCAYSNLNGLYLRGNYSTNDSFNGMEGIYWQYWKGSWYSLKTTEMKISSF